MSVIRIIDAAWDSLWTDDHRPCYVAHEALIQSLRQEFKSRQNSVSQDELGLLAAYLKIACPTDLVCSVFDAVAQGGARAIIRFHQYPGVQDRILDWSNLKRVTNSCPYCGKAHYA